MNKQNSSAGRELYHEIWRVLNERFYAVERLSKWSQWEHRYDDQITDDQSALAFAQIMVESLGDRYTRLVDRHEPQVDESDSDVVVAKRFTHSNIGYIEIKSFDVPDIVSRVEAGLITIADCDALMVNVANNSGGSLYRTLECLALFLGQASLAELQIRTEGGVTVEETYLKGDACVMRTVHPDGSVEMKPYRRNRCLIADKPVALVIGPGTASGAELFTAAMLANRRNTKHHRRGNGYAGRLCWSFGRRTGGKGIMQSPFDILESRALLKVSNGRFLSPDGHWFGDAQADRRGMRADFRVKGPQVRACQLALRHLKRQLHRKAA